VWIKATYDVPCLVAAQTGAGLYPLTSWEGGAGFAMRNPDWVLVGQLAQAEWRASHMLRPQVAVGVLGDTTDLEAYCLTRDPGKRRPRARIGMSRGIR
jgi:hypothetical protein